MDTRDLPDLVFSRRGTTTYKVVKPYIPDSDLWVRLVPINKIPLDLNNKLGFDED